MLVYKRTAPFLTKNVFSVHIDTGAPKFYVSRQCLQRLGILDIPKRVLFVCRGSRHLDSGPVHLAGNDTFDIVMGKEMISRYNCVIEYQTLKMFFHVGHRVIKAQLYMYSL